MAKNPIYKADLVGIQESVVDEMLLLNPHDTPLISLLGFGQPITNVKHEWIEDAMLPDETAINNGEGYLATDTSLVVDDASIFAANDVIKIGEELLLVTAVDAGTNTLTVVRGYAGTTAAAIADDAKVQFMFVEGTEGADARTARKSSRVRVDNITQIIDETIEVSGTALSMSLYGTNGQDPYEYERAKKLMVVAHQLEKALINGIKYENGQVRQMNGVRKFVNTNVSNLQGATLKLDDINQLAQDIYEAGGFKGGSQHIIMVPAKQKVVISNLQADKLRLTQQETFRGQVVDTIVTDFGKFPVILNNNLDPNELFMIDLNRIQIRPLAGREFFHEYLGKKGDYVTGQIVGEYTLEFKQEKAHGRIKNLA
ncbi:DUF5309 family protein [Thermoactinomyces daqus]|uniref:DUF5309 family protein n=1 Tax=Thermoactinomyces daqus TaxID=1329516 RepID=A0A7W2AI48_9BACL|nr:DUF5309 family protein [Thermoactinomyces daqus]MBA4542895.1 DUF5309 family protein [Thermoactinomyces daqus]